MSNPAKRKGPPTKAELITRCVDSGIARERAELEKLTVKEIRWHLKECRPVQTEPAHDVSVKARTEALTRAVALGIADTAAELENLTVKEIWAVIADYKALITGQDEPEPITEKEPGPEEPAMVIHNGALMATDDLPTRELKVDMFPEGAKMEWVPNEDTHPDIPETREPNCGHIFRKVLEIHKGGNIHVNICNICGWREIVG